ncbi:MAG: glycosyltransferase family 4 protein [Acidobacteriota bacterium]|nr:glycosyltransferase family 4 protein [Acidobacteriota bacterium]
MNVLLLNQCFYPDVMATAQQLTDLAVGLVEEGHNVTVIASDRGYDNPAKRFPRRETWKGIRIIRIPSLALGKASRWRRGATFASFLVNCALRLLLLSRFDVVVALTSPPLISFLGALFVRLKGGKFFFWVMDLNPDEAIAAGWLKPDSAPAKILARFLRYSLRHSHGVIALDRFMKQRIVGKGVPEKLVTVLPPWAHDVRFDSEGREAFRRQHELQDNFVVMYAGNHSPCHPLDTLLEAARRLAGEKQIVFCFVGGGSEQGKVREFASRHALENIRCLPYQPFSELSAVLSAADLHTVVMGRDFVGIVHPSKVYNILQVSSPLLYIGPPESHITELAARLNGNSRMYTAAQGDVETIVNQIRAAAKMECKPRSSLVPENGGAFSRQSLLPRLIKLLTSEVLPESQISHADAGYVPARAGDR